LTRPPEDGRDEDQGRAAADDIRVGREGRDLLGVERVAGDRQGRRERIEVVEADLESPDALRGDVELERIVSTTSTLASTSSPEMKITRWPPA
jgi:hypothetical protein